MGCSNDGIKQQHIENKLSATKKEMIGKWLTEVKEVKGLKLGFELMNNDSMHSINMATLVYDHWRIDSNYLYLHGLSIGNGTSFYFTDTFNYILNNNNELILEQDVAKWIYVKE